MDLLPQTSGPLQVLFPPAGRLFSGTLSGEQFLLLELISVGSLQEEVPDPVDKVKAPILCSLSHQPGCFSTAHIKADT